MTPGLAIWHRPGMSPGVRTLALTAILLGTPTFGALAESWYEVPNGEWIVQYRSPSDGTTQIMPRLSFASLSDCQRKIEMERQYNEAYRSAVRAPGDIRRANGIAFMIETSVCRRR